MKKSKKFNNQSLLVANPNWISALSIPITCNGSPIVNRRGSDIISRNIHQSREVVAVVVVSDVQWQSPLRPAAAADVDGARPPRDAEPAEEVQRARDRRLPERGRGDGDGIGDEPASFRADEVHQLRGARR